MPLNELISEAAKKGAMINPCLGKMCTDCAFKKGTDANNDEDAVNAAMECIAGNDIKFHCHTMKDGKLVDNGPCAGYLFAKIYFDKMDRELEVIDNTEQVKNGK